LSPVIPGASALQGLLPPAYGEFSSETFAKYRPDPTAAAQLMQAAGWAKGKDGFWSKGGEKLTIDLKVSSASPRDQQAARLVQTQLQAAGFVVGIEAESPAQLLAGEVPAGIFAAALYPVDLRRRLPTAVPVGAGIDDSDPGQCRLFCTASIPTAANGGVGNNYDRISDPTLDRYLSDLDANLNDEARLSDATEAATILADLVPAIPLAALPDLVVVNTAKIGVEGGTFSHNLAYGPYEYLNEWYLK
jgi:peptide/nickel transport system substrate-binding protein